MRHVAEAVDDDVVVGGAASAKFAGARDELHNDDEVDCERGYKITRHRFLLDAVD